MCRSSLLGLSLMAAAFLGACTSGSGRDRYPVFFEAGSTTISPVGAQIVAQAAAEARASNAKVVEVVGHAAAHGTNLSAEELLAVDRAKAVAAELMKDGVGGAQITQIAHPPHNSQAGTVASRYVSIEIDPATP
ncbi:OmpA family protein [Acidomonas methanolica]|uniref:OmpA family protein n=1 Tax=Acidomonas methanolica TaxID=437 RepID=UPI00211A2512|nr:OmpA family protein [Acidomonas methanolica]MCQ9155087.1 OmpA family protein [Acidomonas methanolica]